MNVTCTTSNISSSKTVGNNSENSLVSTTSASGSTVRKEAIVGKIAALPQNCQWCYREYATRAKLLQHQRKAHINLMPAKMQVIFLTPNSKTIFEKQFLKLNF